jgi:nucleoside-diphosphate-sugar epimerase
MFKPKIIMTGAAGKAGSVVASKLFKATAPVDSLASVHTKTTSATSHPQWMESQ